jgi:hypothetical protein
LRQPDACGQRIELGAQVLDPDDREAEAFQPLELGGLLVRYGAGDRTGSAFSEPVMLGSGKSIVR